MSHQPVSPPHPWQPRAWSTSTVSERHVAEVASARFVQLPSWFTVTSARRVMQAKGVGHALVEKSGRVVGSVAAGTLAGAPDQQPVARWMMASTASVSADATVDQALAILSSEATDCLPVVAGRMLVGVVTRDDLEAGHASVADRRSAA